MGEALSPLEYNYIQVSYIVSTAQAHIAGIAALPNGRYDVPERDLALNVALDALNNAEREPRDLDGIYMPKPRPWTPQGFFSTLLANLLGATPRRTVETYTGGTSGGSALQTAVGDVRAGRVQTALVLAVERNSIIDTEDYFSYILSIFDQEFQAPAGPSIPAVYAQSMQRYCHEYGIDRDDLASVVVKNRANAVANQEAIFDAPVTTEAVLDSRPIAEPLCLYECPRPCDGAAALIVTDDKGIAVAGTGAHHSASHLVGTRSGSLATFPAVGGAVEDALGDADLTAVDVDVFEPYAPFPHVEAILTEEIGFFDRGEGAAACARGETAPDGTYPVSPSGGCLGRGHPAMVTPLLNHIAAVRQLRGEAHTQIPDTETVVTTSEHGHVDGATATVFGGGA